MAFLCEQGYNRRTTVGKHMEECALDTDYQQFRPYRVILALDTASRCAHSYDAASTRHHKYFKTKIHTVFCLSCHVAILETRGVGVIVLEYALKSGMGEARFQHRVHTYRKAWTY